MIELNMEGVLMSFRFYRFPFHQHGVPVDGNLILQHLISSMLINQCLGIKDLDVRGWIADPSTFPQELRVGGLIILWKSWRVVGMSKVADTLYWQEVEEGGIPLSHKEGLEVGNITFGSTRAEAQEFGYYPAVVLVV